MALADDIWVLRDRVRADLNAIHDYHSDTIIAWGFVHDMIRAGRTFTIRNLGTGTVTTHLTLPVRAQEYVGGPLAEATFQQMISVFESSFFDFLRLWLMAYPQNLIGKQVSFKDVLEAPDKDAITLLVVNKELNEILYKRPAEWFVYLEERVKLGCPTPDEIERIAEAKASRDVLAHNRGVATKSYEWKAGKRARYKDGQKIDIPEPYHRQTWELLRKIVTDMTTAAGAKAP